MELRSLPVVLLAPLVFATVANAAPGPEPKGAVPPPPPLAESAEVSTPPAAPQPPPPAEPPPPAPTPAAPLPPPEPLTDHARVIGHLGLGYLTTPTLLVGAGVDGTTAEVQAPVLGVRYWFRPQLGLDVGLGVVVATDRTATAAGQTKAPPASGAVLHLGGPWSVSTGNHYSFQILPEANVGFASQTVTADGLADLKNSGFHFDLGARAGAEIQFGFMGLPMLSLQGNVGVRLDYDSTKSTQGGESAETSAFRLATVPYGDPWDLFTGSIAALYYL